MANFYSYFHLGADNLNNNGPYKNADDNFHVGAVSANNGVQKKVMNIVDEQKLNLSMEDQQWNLVATKLAFENQMRVKPDQLQSGSFSPSSKPHPLHHHKPSIAGQNKGPKNIALKHQKHRGASAAQNDMVNNMIDKLLTLDTKSDIAASQKGILSHAFPSSHKNVHNPLQTTSPNSISDKRFKSLPPSESLPRNEALGGYIFVCNNDTMQEDLKRQLFGLPQRYRDSVRTILPGLPLFLYNYTTHQLHGIYEAASFGGSNIDPTAWEDKKNKGESRFPAQVRIRVRKVCKPLEEDAFRPVLFHYDGPKFRLQLSIPETLSLMDLLSENR